MPGKLLVCGRCIREGYEMKAKEFDKELLQDLTFEVLYLERKNLRSRAKTDQKMAEELQKIIVEYARRSYAV